MIPHNWRQVQHEIVAEKARGVFDPVFSPESIFLDAIHYDLLFCDADRVWPAINPNGRGQVAYMHLLRYLPTTAATAWRH